MLAAPRGLSSYPTQYLCSRRDIDSCQCNTADNSKCVGLPGCAIWTSQRRPPFTAHRALIAAGNAYAYSICVFLQEVITEWKEKAHACLSVP